MNQITRLKNQIKQEILRLEQASTLNLEKEQKKLALYEQLTQEILKNHG
jgi:hypothetical protein